MAFSLTTELTPDLLVSMTGAVAITVISSATPGLSMKSSVVALPTLTTILSNFTPLKPESSPATV